MGIPVLASDPNCLSYGYNNPLPIVVGMTNWKLVVREEGIAGSVNTCQRLTNFPVPSLRTRST